MPLPPIRLKAGRLSPQIIARQGAGQVHSVFHQVVNLTFGEGMLTLAADTLPPLPDTLPLPPACLAQARLAPPGSPVYWKGERLTLGALALELDAAALQDTPFVPPPWTRAHCQALLAACAGIPGPTGFAGLPPAWQKRVEEALAAYARALEAGAESQAVIRPILGLGPGATPSADDAILAISAMFPYKRVIYFQKLLAGTSQISAKYLNNAQNGYYASTLSALISAPTPGNAAALAACGATSGRDMLYGLSIGCRQLLREVF